MLNFVAKAGFGVVILLAMVGISSILGRFVATVQYLSDPSTFAAATQDPGPGFEPPVEFNARYYRHPYLTLVHIGSGFVFMVLGPLQFVAAIRNRWINFHRWCGRAFLMASVICVLSALSFVWVLPVFGTLTASVAVIVASLVFSMAILQGYRHIRRFEIAEHREWMIRALAIGLGISTFRLLIPFLMIVFDVSFEETWDTVAWLGFVINAGVAEVWIHVTRGRVLTQSRRPSPARNLSWAIPAAALSDANVLRVDQ